MVLEFNPLRPRLCCAKRAAVSVLVLVLLGSFSLSAPDTASAASSKKSVAAKKAAPAKRKRARRVTTTNPSVAAKSKVEPVAEALPATAKAATSGMIPITIESVAAKSAAPVLIDSVPIVAEGELADARGIPPAASSAVPMYLSNRGTNLVDGFVRNDEGRLYRELGNNTRAYLTLDADMQEYAEQLLKKHRVPWGAIVAIEPKTGKVLAMAGHSQQDPQSQEFSLRGGMPAASLFKMITAAAALEEAGLEPDSQIKFRGGNYVLGPRNYQPDSKRDTRVMTLEKALALSCNPVFGRVASKYLSADVLTRYAGYFGFNRRVPFDVALPASSFEQPQNAYELARTAAGFGPAMISPVHAALMASALGNGGVMMRPRLVDYIEDSQHKIVYRARPEVFQRAISAPASRQLLEMMEETTVTGTARKQFSKAKNGPLKNIKVAAKTGTLSGTNPKGVYHWLVALAPAEEPEIAIATVVVDPGHASINGTGLGRLFLDQYFRSRDL